LVSGSQLAPLKTKSTFIIDIAKFVEGGTAFDPETVKLPAYAFEDDGAAFKKCGNRFARPLPAPWVREVIAKRIFEMAQQGVTDPQALAEDAVRFVRANYKDDLSGKA
jgi:hypothetical protein